MGQQMNYRILGYKFLYILFKFLYKLYKHILKAIVFFKKRINIALWQVVLIAVFGAIIFYGSSLSLSHIALTGMEGKDTTNFKIVISKIGIEKDVNEGADENILNKGPGHFPGTALPNEKTGNVVIFGHSAKTQEHDDPFGRLDELGKDDEVKLIYERKEYKYQVTEKKIIDSTDMSVTDPAEESTLTLITCIKPDFPKDKRLVIRAQKI